jgi:D-psicose/D-tagatose/L-ribulose 3-epimerase
VKYGVNTLIWTGAFDRSHLEVLPRIREWGFDGVEVAVFSFEGFPAREVRREIERSGLECTFCSVLPAPRNAISGDESARRAARTYMEDCIKTAADIGAQCLAGPFYSPVGHLEGRRRTEEEWRREVAFLQSLGPTLDANGVDLAVEPLNRFETYFLNTAADAVSLCAEVGHPRVGVLLDTFHMNIEEPDIFASIRDCGERIFHFHVADSNRWHPGAGHLDFRSILAALCATGYDGYVSGEFMPVPDADTGAQRAIQVLRSMI